MPLNRTNTLSFCLIGAGVICLAWSGNHLLDPAFAVECKTPLNPMGINRSPYGQVFAMAMQGPIDTAFHAGMYGATAEEAALRLRQHSKSLNESPIPHLDEKLGKAERIARSNPWALSAHLQAMIARMESGYHFRTNPIIASKKLRDYLRNETEQKLRFANRLDPAHYANYNSLHFFLTEGIATHQEPVDSVMKLARETIDYCRQQQDDPRPSLTAAAACTNILHVLFAEHRQHPQPDQIHGMKATLAELDSLIANYHRIADQWTQEQAWQRLSRQRIDECETRIFFISRIRDAAEMTIHHIENKS